MNIDDYQIAAEDAEPCHCLQCDFEGFASDLILKYVKRYGRNIGYCPECDSYLIKGGYRDNN